MELKELIMSSQVISTDKKLQLINAIKKWEINENDLDKIIKFLEKNKNEIDNITQEYVENMKKEYNKYLSKKIPILKKEVSLLKIKTNEIISEELEWNPDKILENI